MTEAYCLLTDVQADYVAMCRELAKVKRQVVTPIDPWSLPLVQRMEKGRRDLAMAIGIPYQKRTP